MLLIVLFQRVQIGWLVALVSIPTPNGLQQKFNTEMENMNNSFLPKVKLTLFP